MVAILDLSVIVIWLGFSSMFGVAENNGAS